MRAAPAPRLHLFVCANRREDSPLGPGCAGNGDELYDALKREVTTRGAIATTWITKTACLGICPKRGATVARYPAGSSGAVTSEVSPSDIEALLSLPATTETKAAPAAAPARAAHPGEVSVGELARELDLLEELQRKKVLDLARRLKPGLTLEDVQNPHDFPELDDPDWHYADGVLTGISSVKSALAALSRGKRED